MKSIVHRDDCLELLEFNLSQVSSGGKPRLEECDHPAKAIIFIRERISGLPTPLILFAGTAIDVQLHLTFLYSSFNHSGRRGVSQPTAVNTHLLGPYASQQLVLSQQEVPLEPPLGRVGRRDRVLGASEVDFVVFLEVKPGCSRPGIDGARHASESRVPAHGAEQPPHVRARLEARRAA